MPQWANLKEEEAILRFWWQRLDIPSTAAQAGEAGCLGLSAQLLLSSGEILLLFKELVQVGYGEAILLVVL